MAYGWIELSGCSDSIALTTRDDLEVTNLVRLMEAK